MAKSNKRLKLSDNNLFLGVVAGFGEFTGIDVTLLRVLFAFFVVVTGFFPGVFFYFVAWFIMKASAGDFDTATDKDDVIEVKAKPKKK